MVIISFKFRIINCIKDLNSRRDADRLTMIRERRKKIIYGIKTRIEKRIKTHVSTYEQPKGMRYPSSIMVLVHPPWTACDTIS